MFYVSKSEMGQGSSTGLAMLVAEELHVSLDQLQVEQAPYDPRYGNQTTGGSSSIRKSWQPLREAAAITRELLVTAAARQWQVANGICRAEHGRVRNLHNGEQLDYGKLVTLARELPLPKHVALRSADFRLIGTSPARVDMPDKVNGRAVFAADVKLKGMLTASVVHCPYFSGKLADFDAKAALALPGVHKVFAIESGLAIVADNYWLTEQARQRLKIRWQRDPAAEPVPVADYHSLLDQPGIVVKRQGQPGDISGTRQVEAVYEFPYQAHATMEPMCCTARIEDGRVQVWAPTQNPGQAAAEAQAYGLSWLSRLLDKARQKLFRQHSEDVEVFVTQLGGGFGRRLQQDYVAEVVQIARRVGRPVRLVWSREEDMQHDYYHPATTHRLSAWLRPDGRIANWKHKLVGGSLNEFLVPGSTGKGGDEALTEGATRLPYAMDAMQVEYYKLISRVPLGPWRSVGHAHNGFVVECFIDELAHAAGRDPLDYRRQLLREQPQQLAVLELAADRAGWGRPLPAGHFHGLAVHSGFGSHVAQVAEVSVHAGQIRVHKVTCAVDCGIAVDPDAVRAQMESAVVFGLSAALKSAITVEDGKVSQSNFHDFPILRMSETPQVNTYFVNKPRDPGGVGEPGVPPVAPAVANAVFAASGVRLRRLPLQLPTA
jgi:isoquinoline 1-oxidoreductase beta subunit